MSDRRFYLRVVAVFIATGLWIVACYHLGGLIARLAGADA